MEEIKSFEKKINPIPEAVRSLLNSDLAKEFEASGATGVYEQLGKYLERLNISPDFTKQQDERFSGWRERLNTERGVMISNHPSLIDAILLAPALTRSDVKIFVNRSFYRRSDGTGFQKMLIPSAKDTVSEIRNMLNVVRTLIAEGGLVWIFPSGGKERLERSSMQFASGFSLILKELAPEDMVYSFNINGEDLEKVASPLNVNISFLSGHLVPDTLTMAHLRDTQRVRIDERYSNAEEWQDILRQADKKEKNDVLTQHYLHQFNPDKPAVI